MNLSRPAVRHRNQGSALIAVFWLIGVLGMVVYAGARALDGDTRQARLARGRMYARQLALQGLEIGRHPLVTQHDPLLRHDDGHGGSFEVQLVAEEARLNVNVLAASDGVLLRRLFLSWGVPDESAAALCDAIRDWVDSDDKASFNGAERRHYQEEGLEGLPFNRPFQRVEDLRMVLGMREVEALRPDWREWFTVYGDGRIDVNDARPELIALLADVPVERVAPLVKYRSGKDSALGTRDDVRLGSAVQVAQLLGVYQPHALEFLTQWVQFTGPIRRIESLGRFGNVSRRLVLITQNQRPLWRGELPPHVQNP